MSRIRDIYGIEYDSRRMNDDSSGPRWIVVAVVVVAVISLGWTLIIRFRASEDPTGAEKAPETKDAPVETLVSQAPSRPPPAVVPPPPPVQVPPPPVVVPEEPPVQTVTPKMKDSYPKRPVKVRNLLMRLEEAEKRKDVEMAVTTIETIRALPGAPAADLDDSLARRLGSLNLKRLFVLRNAQWVKVVTVKRGDSVSRLAVENGSTVASLLKLNGGKLDKVVLGRKLYVMNHPRFNLIIHRRSRTADLCLNGKFFRRYDLIGGVTGKEGAYELPSRTRNFWQGELGVQLKAADRAELELLMPTGAAVLISEM